MSQPLRLLQLVTVRWYNACAEYAIQLSAGLASRGHRVVVGGFPGSPVLEVARKEGLQVLDVFDFRPGRLDFLATLLRFRGYLAGSGFDLVNAHRAEDHLFARLALGRGRRVPLVRTRGDVRPPRRNLANRLLYERYTDAHVLAAEFMRSRFYAGFRIPAERLVTIRPGIDAEAWRQGLPARVPAREALDLPRQAPLVGMIGRLTAAKGHLVALEAFARLARRVPDARLVIAGETQDVSPGLLHERAQHLGIDRALILRPRLDDVRTLMAALDVGLIASTASEAICRVALEYQAVGVPLVATDLNSIPEIVVHGRTGLIVPPGDPAAMAQALERLLTEPLLAERFAAEGPEQVKRNYGRAGLLDATETLYRRLLREAR